MDNVTIKIRKATQNDIRAISNVLKMAFSDYFKVLGVKIPTVSEADEDILREIENKNVYVALANNMLIVGTIRFEIIDDMCYISRFGILPKWQSSGCGKMLLAKVEEFCNEKGIKYLSLHTATKLKKQIMYYYSQGFYIAGINSDKGYIRGHLIKEL